jgi:Kef-type K+ transport system membrane component KefB
MKNFCKKCLLVFGLGIVHQTILFASDGQYHAYALSFLWIAIALFAAKLGGMIEKITQPAVLGELLMGTILGNLFLLGIDYFQPMKSDVYLQFLGEIGIVILLFQVGLESNVKQMQSIGLRAFFVAIIGVLAPYLLGRYFAGPYLMPGFSDQTYIFLGATLTATSIGITARVFKDFNIIDSKESKIIIGAAIIDDIIGLIILAIVTAIIQNGSFDTQQLLITSSLALGFLIASIVGGSYAAPFLGKWLSHIHAGQSMKLTFALCLGFLLAYLADAIGLSPIIGAFSAGLMLDSTHFKDFHSSHLIKELQTIGNNQQSEIETKILTVAERANEKHIEELIAPIGQFTTPIFFIITGMSVDLMAFTQTSTILLGILLTVIAVIGKLLSGFAAGKGVKHWMIGWGMVPRGEVGLIFASVGKSLGVINANEYSVIIMVIISTTFISPIMLNYLIKRYQFVS